MILCLEPSARFGAILILQPAIRIGNRNAVQYIYRRIFTGERWTLAVGILCWGSLRGRERATRKTKRDGEQCDDRDTWTESELEVKRTKRNRKSIPASRNGWVLLNVHECGLSLLVRAGRGAMIFETGTLPPMHLLRKRPHDR